MVISIIIVVVGLVSMASLPIAQFPNIVPPEIQITATYTGADAMLVEGAVAAPIEEQVTGVEDMAYMRSYNSSTGNFTLDVTFNLGTNSNDDQNNTNVRLQNAMSLLPESVQKQGLSVRQASSSPMMLIAVYSPGGEYDIKFLSNYVYINMNDPLTRVYGVGQVTVYGAGQYAMRVWVKPDQMASLGVQVSDIEDALEGQNVANPSGQLGAQPVPSGQQFTYTVRSQGRLITTEQFENIIIKAKTDGSLVRIKDVARVELGVETYTVNSTYDGGPSAIINIQQSPGTNAVQSAKAVRALLKDLSKAFPSGIQYDVALDTTEAVTASIDDIVTTLWQALGLVMLVVFIFLQGWRATLIPMIAIPVALIGTFILFVPLGFSINTLSLFGLVLAVGLVVDDAIVVVEAVERHIEQGKTPRAATLQAMKEVKGPILATAMILAAVFVPTAAIPGISGQLYQQFAVAIACSVAISAFNAMTLSPALCALLLRPRGKPRGILGKFWGGFNKGVTGTTNFYMKTCHFLVRKTAVALFVLVGITVAAVFMGYKIPTAFIPDEDQGYFFIDYQLPASASLQRTTEVGDGISKVIKELPGVESTINVQGYDFISAVNTSYDGFAAVMLKPWSERNTKALGVNALIKNANERLEAQIPGAVAFAFPPPAIPGVGTAGGFDLMIQDKGGNTPEYLAKWTQKYLEAAEKRPEIETIHSLWIPSVPQKYADIDRDKVRKLGIEISDVQDTLSAFLGGLYVNLFNRFGRTWQVYIQADGEHRQNTDDIEAFYVRNKTGTMVPMNTLMEWKEDSGPEFTNRMNEYRAAEVVGSSAEGYSSNQVMTALEEVAHEVLPSDMGFEWYGMSYQQNLARTGTPASYIFGLSIFFVFLIMAAMYESWSLPLAVLFCTPIAVFGAFGGLMIRGYEDDVYAQIGLIMMIGLAAKNAILIIEFAKMRFDEGEELLDATLEGAKLRLRPIVMTAFAFILGTLPLAIATGSGAVGRRVLGTIVVFGMLASTLIAVFIIPTSFVVVMKWFRVKRRPRGTHPEDDAPVASPPSAAEGAAE